MTARSAAAPHPHAASRPQRNPVAQGHRDSHALNEPRGAGTRLSMRPVILTPSRSAGDQSMRPGAALCCLAALALASPLHVSALTIVPKPQYQAMNATVLTLDAKRFTFAATGNDSPLLQAAFTRYAALLGRSSRGLTSAGLADQRSLDWPVQPFSRLGLCGSAHSFFLKRHRQIPGHYRCCRST